MIPEEMLLTKFFHSHPDEAARLMEQMPPQEVAGLLEEVSPEPAAAVMQRMAPFAGRECLAVMAPSSAGPILGGVPLKIAAGFLRRMEPEVQSRLFSGIPRRVIEPLRLLLSYSEETVGALMDPLATVLPMDTRVDQALDRIRRDPLNVYYNVYVVDRTHRLVGALNLKELMMADADDLLSSIMQKNVVTLRPRMDFASLALHPAWSDYDALPVVDEEGIFLGMIRQRLVRQMGADMSGRSSGQGEWGAMLGLAELYWVGMRELVEVLSVPLTQRSPIPQQAEKGAGQ